MTVSSFFGAFVASGIIHNDAPPPDDSSNEVVAQKEPTPETEGAEEDAEPEDPAPSIREECTKTTACAPLSRHFAHCTEKVTSGQGFPHEDCVEELFHVMHCVDNCLAPKLFSKLT